MLYVGICAEEDVTPLDTDATHLLQHCMRCLESLPTVCCTKSYIKPNTYESIHKYLYQARKPWLNYRSSVTLTGTTHPLFLGTMELDNTQHWAPLPELIDPVVQCGLGHNDHVGP